MGPRTRSRVSALRLVHARASRLDDAGRPRRAQRADDAHASDRHRPSDAARGAPHAICRARIRSSAATRFRKRVWANPNTWTSCRPSASGARWSSSCLSRDT